jgi:hypothetical protein
MASKYQNTKPFEINKSTSGTKAPQAQPPRNPDEFVDNNVLPDPPMDMRVSNDEVSDINEVVLKKVQEQSKKSIQPKSVNDISVTNDSIEKIIRPIEKVTNKPTVKTDDKIISAIDRVSTEELVNIVTKPKPSVILKPQIVDSARLSEQDKRRLAVEEDKRRKLENERSADIQQSFEEEQERRQLFDEEIEVMKFEFEQYLKEQYSEFDKSNIANKEVVVDPPSPEELQAKEEEKQRLREERRRNKQQQKAKKRKLQKQKLQRLEREKDRKSQENEFQINRLREDEIQIFLEDDVILEQKEKMMRNPEIEGLSDVQIKLKEIEQYEMRLGRPIVPHRDIVESDESDLDPKSYTNFDDILIKIPSDLNVVDDLDKLNKLREYRAELEQNSNDNVDFIIDKNNKNQ